MGVPVVTLTGNRHAAQVSTSLLQTVGHREWIAENFDEYIVIAKTLAQSPGRLETVRSNLRDKLMRSPLMDQPGKASEFGNALRDCWRKWCQAT